MRTTYNLNIASCVIEILKNKIISSRLISTDLTGPTTDQKQTLWDIRLCLLVISLKMI